MSEQKKTSWLAWGAAVLFIVLVAYPLSAGPFAWLAYRIEAANGGDTPAWLNAISYSYFPIAVVAEAHPRVQEFLNEYVQWWVDP